MSERDPIFRILHHKHLELITKVIQVADICGIESIIIGDDWIRGIDKHDSVCIVHQTDIGLPFKSLALNQAHALKRKFHLAAKMGDLVVNILVVPPVPKIVFTGYAQNGKRTVFDHRCAHPAQVKAPFAIDETFTNTLVKPPKWIYKFLVQASKAAKLAKGGDAGKSGGGGVELVGIKSGQDGLSLELRDDGKGDGTSLQLHEQPCAKFCNRYSLRVFKALLKVSPEETLMIGQKGILKMRFKGLDVYILPMVA